MIELSMFLGLEKKKWKWIIRFFLIISGFLILFWSLVSTGLVKLKNDLRENSLRNVPIEYIKEFENGEKIKRIYKVPESNVLPGNWKYGIKKFRDELWIFLSRTPIEKAEIYLLMADKRMFETTELIKNGDSNELIDRTLDDAFWKLKGSKESLLEEIHREAEFMKINIQINRAGLVYEDIVKSFSYKSEKKEKILNEIKIWNQKNQEIETKKI